MSNSKVVLVTDYAWPNLSTEREILAEVGARLLVAEDGSVEELVRLAPSADAILFNWRTVSAPVLQAAQRCLTASRYGIGVDNIDLEAATALGIIVTNVPQYCVDDVADYTMALLLACTRKVAWFDRDIKAGKYDLKAQVPLLRLRGRTLGVAGFGKIGRVVAQRAAAFGLRVVALQPQSGYCSEQREVEFVSFPELLAQSDYISIHLPATPATNKLFDKSAFQRMKGGVVLINTARGSLIGSEDLLEALQSGKVAAAGLDVWEKEPLPDGDLLAQHPRVIASPHAAFYSAESLLQLQSTAASQIATVLAGGKPENVVNGNVLTQPNLRACFHPQQERVFKEGA